MEKYTLTITTEKAVPIAYWGSLMHGMLMQHLPEDLAAALHATELRPFSQWVEPMDGHTFRWHVQVTDDTLAEAVTPLFISGTVWDCDRLREGMTFTDCTHEHTTLQAWTKDFFLAPEPHRTLRLTLHTATTHKSAGRYVIFPSVALTAYSLQQRMLMMDSRSVYAEEDVMQQLIDATVITRYRLQSCTYAMEGVYLPGFLGAMELTFRGPDPLLRLADMLFSFAEWSGVGAKTALGMGGCTVAPVIRSVRNKGEKQPEV